MKNNIQALKNGTWLVESDYEFPESAIHARDTLFLGIDFGTSTTVVSKVSQGGNYKSFSIQPLVLSQPSAHGGVIRDTLVNTVLSYRNEQLFFGQDAYNLRPRLTEGRNTFSSFKMGLGLDLGPEYASTVLPAGRVAGITIERPADAAREFFKLLVEAIQVELLGQGMPKNVKYAFTVPAAFQANQRRDLLSAIKNCGLDVNESCLIDEPNAAFLSYIYEAARSQEGSDIIALARQGKVNVLVYDFGAGTCDVSLVEFSISDVKVVSRNRGISKFTALGGDDIDRSIARQVLIGQLRDRSGLEVEFTSIDIDEKIIPRLMPAAERLKVSLSRMLEGNEISRLEEARNLADVVFETQPVSAFKMRGAEVSIERPSLSLCQFLDILETFCGEFSRHNPGHHVAAPIHDVLDKASMDFSEVDAVLFIGGSVKNPLIRSAVMDCFPLEVAAIVPKNLQTHVSQGAAIHSIGIHGFGFDFIAPITSDAIQVVTKGGALESLIPASSSLPSQSPFRIELAVSEDRQAQIDVPICSSTNNRLIGIVSIHPRKGSHFMKGNPVLVEGSISKEKLLEVKVSVAGQTARAEILNPLSNGAASPAELAMLKEKQKFNESMLRNNGRPSASVVKAYSQAAAKCGAYELAADLLVALERIDPSLDHATDIGYYYSMAGRGRKSREWGAIAYGRKKTALTAYNMACEETDLDKKERLLRESLRYDPDYSLALRMLSDLLATRDPDEARELRRRLVTILEDELCNNEISLRDLKTLEKAAAEIGKHETAETARKAISRKERSLEEKEALYLDKHLATKSISLLDGGK